MLRRLVFAAALAVGITGVAGAQVVTYYQPVAPVVVGAPALPATPVVPAKPRVTYYAPSISVPATTFYAPAPVPAPAAVTTYYAPAVVAPAAPVTTYYAPSTAVYYAPPATNMRVNEYHSSVSSMSVGSVPSAAPAPAVVAAPPGAPAVETLAPPVITYRPVIAAPQAYVVTRGLFGRPKYQPVAPAPLVPVYVP